MTQRVTQCGRCPVADRSEDEWARLVSNQRPLACEASRLPRPPAQLPASTHKVPTTLPDSARETGSAGSGRDRAGSFGPLDGPTVLTPAIVGVVFAVLLELTKHLGVTGVGL